ncbi:MAG: ATP-grasp domain-containing protein [Candidatus Helarchaeota archaeon]
MKRILILGAGGPAAYNFIEALKLVKDEEFFFIGSDANKWHLELMDVNRSYLVPYCSTPGYYDLINDIINENDIEFVHAQPDIEVEYLSENREKVNARTFLPSKETVRICQNKEKSAIIWERNGLIDFKTIKLSKNNLETDLEIAANELGFPFWIRAIKGAGGKGSTPVNNLETAKSWINYWYSRGVSWEFIAQEYLPGRNIAFHSIFRDGELIVSQSRERLEYIYPYLAPSGITGTPVVQKTVHNQKVNEIATNAVLSIDDKASGIFCVDLKFNKNNTPCPTEINAGRFFTSNLFFAYLGSKLGIPEANLQYLYIKLGFNEELPQKIKQYNILPKDYFWIRHIDCGYHLVYKDNLKGIERI